MKPIIRKVLPNTYYTNKPDVGSLGPGSISGKVEREDGEYLSNVVCLFSRKNLLPIIVKRTDQDGYYHLSGLNKSQSYFLVSFDNSFKYNGVIQDEIFAV